MRIIISLEWTILCGSEGQFCAIPSVSVRISAEQEKYKQNRHRNSVTRVARVPLHGVQRVKKSRIVIQPNDLVLATKNLPGGGFPKNYSVYSNTFLDINDNYWSDFST